MTQTCKRLIIAPHADDETLGCGGLLAKYPNECFVVIMAEPDDVRLKEFKLAHEILGYSGYQVLNFRDGYLAQDPAALVAQLDQVIAALKPQMLYVPHPGAHQDHIAVYEAGIRAGRLSMTLGHHYAQSLYLYDVAAYDLELYPTKLDWNVFESLSEREIDLKVQALGMYSSQSVFGPHPINGIKAIAQGAGNARRVDWAEPFALVREVRA